MRTARTPAQWGLDGRDRRRLANALPKLPKVRTYRRVQAVLAVARGQPLAQAAALTGVGPSTVYGWVQRYLRRHRLDDLAERRRSGRPRVAPGITPARLAREFAKDPLALGYAATSWTVALLAHHLGRRYGVKLTRRTLRRRMKALGLVWKRPRHVYRDPAPHLPQKKGGLFAA